MRKSLLASLLTLAGLFGLGTADPAKADDLRVFVRLGDVYHRGGNPYYRYHDLPLSVVYYDHRPRYYVYLPRPAYHHPYYRPHYGAYYGAHDYYRHHTRHHDGYGGHRGYYRHGHDYRDSRYHHPEEHRNRGHEHHRHDGERDHRRR